MSSNKSITARGIARKMKGAPKLSCVPRRNTPKHLRKKGQSSMVIGPEAFEGMTRGELWKLARQLGVAEGIAPKARSTTIAKRCGEAIAAGKKMDLSIE